MFCGYYPDVCTDYINDGVYGSFNCILFNHQKVCPHTSQTPTDASHTSWTPCLHTTGPHRPCCCVPPATTTSAPHSLAMPHQTAAAAPKAMQITTHATTNKTTSLTLAVPPLHIFIDPPRHLFCPRASGTHPIMCKPVLAGL